jgi:hypothetical protein
MGGRSFCPLPVVINHITMNSPTGGFKDYLPESDKVYIISDL